jgi:hypothetical protein
VQNICQKSTRKEIRKKELKKSWKEEMKAFIGMKEYWKSAV